MFKCTPWTSTLISVRKPRFVPPPGTKVSAQRAGLYLPQVQKWAETRAGAEFGLLLSWSENVILSRPYGVGGKEQVGQEENG